MIAKLIAKLDAAVALLKEEMDKFAKGNKSAGTRARKVLQDIKKISQELRGVIQSQKKGEATDFAGYSGESGTASEATAPTQPTA